MPYSDSDRVERQAKADPLFLLGAVVLAFVAGYINTIALMYFHVPVSHMSGVVSKISIDVASGNSGELRNLLFIFCGFLSGALTSGYVIGASDFSQKREYSFVLLMEAFSILLALLLLRASSDYGLLFIAFACGLQNAMGSSYLGLIIRTTHVTGIVTDLGVLLGQAARHMRVKKWKVAFLSGILGGFSLGGFAALLGFNRFSYLALFLPAAICAFASAVFYRFRVSPRAEEKNRETGLGLGEKPIGE